MMKKLLFVFALFAAIALHGQNKISSGEYWFDNDLLNKKGLAIAPASEVNILVNLSVEELFDGLHTVHLRFVDDSSRWSSTVSKFFIKQTVKDGASTILVSDYQYWFDNNYNSKIEENITDLASFNLDKAFDLTHLFNGLHTVHFRFKDTKGSWSSVMSKFFIKTNINGESAIKEITAYEYWFDTNLSNRETVAIQKMKNFTINEMKDVSSLSKGLHTVHFRFRDSEEHWSSVVSKFFIISKRNNNTTASEISTFEYWFDNRIDERISSNIVNTTNFTLNEEINVEDLNDGLHTLHYRFGDNHGLFSSAISRFFIVRTEIADISDNKIVACRYWINDSVMHTIDLKNSAHDLIFIDSLDLRIYNKGEYIVNVQFQDEQGLWSSAVSDTIQKLAYLYAELRANMYKSCLGDSIQFSSFVADADLLEWDLGDGTKDTLQSVSHQYSKTGSYPISMIVKDTVSDQSKTFTMDAGIEIFPAASVDVGDSLTLFKNETTVLDAGNNFAEYYWNLEAGESTYEFVAVENGLGRHLIRLDVKDQNGCLASDTIIIHVASADGVSQVNTMKIKVFPNPSSEFITIGLGKSVQSSIEVRIIDLQGKVVLQKSRVVSNDQISIKHLSSGQYLLQINLNGMFHTVPIQKL